MSPDPYKASAGPRDPGSWNRYAYTRGDPTNRFDRAGTCDQSADTPYSVTVCADVDTDDSGIPLIGDITVTGQGGAYARSGNGIFQQALETNFGMMNARDALFAFADTHFSAQCADFINNIFGAGTLATLQQDAASVGVEDAQEVTTAAGATLFPYNADLADAQQGRADQQTGIADTTLAVLGFSSPTTWAWGQWGGNTIFINNAAEWMNFGSGFAMYTMFHEMLHVAAMGGDTQIENDFGISQTLRTQQGTMSITYKLMQECGQ
jgi:hypothetical protein